MNHNDNKIFEERIKKNLPLAKVRNYLKQKQNKAEVKTSHQGFKGLTNIKKQIIKFVSINCGYTHTQKKTFHVEASTNHVH